MSQTYTYTKDADAEDLFADLLDEFGDKIAQVTYAFPKLTVVTAEALSTEDAEKLDLIVYSHDKDAPNAKRVAARKLSRCMAFGQQMIADFGGRNTAMQLTQEQTMMLASTFANIQLLFMSGSLKLARTAIQAINPAAIQNLVTEEDKAYYVGQINRFLETL